MCLRIVEGLIQMEVITVVQNQRVRVFVPVIITTVRKNCPRRQRRIQNQKTTYRSLIRILQGSTPCKVSLISCYNSKGEIGV